ncbi:MAG: hypothetical protein HUK06_01630 [Bacteroidaceae bacterium]|nr:hypothetical protein [Bacteroidaceae bacterium]
MPYAKPLKPKKKQKAIHSRKPDYVPLQAMPYNIRYAIELCDYTIMNTINYFNMGIAEVVDWLEEHIPDDLQGCEQALATIIENEKNHYKRNANYKDAKSNKNRTLMMRYFTHPDLMAYREKIKKNVSMRAVRNHYRKPYLVGWCCLLYMASKVLIQVLRDVPVRLSDNLRCAHIDIRRIDEIVKDIDIESMIRELTQPVSKLIGHLLEQTGMDENTFQEYIAWSSKNDGEYIDIFANIHIKDICDSINKMVDEEQRQKQ